MTLHVDGVFMEDIRSSMTVDGEENVDTIEPGWI